MVYTGHLALPEYEVVVAAGGYDWLGCKTHKCGIRNAHRIVLNKSV
jgi:hypothetical protein